MRPRPRARGAALAIAITLVAAPVGAFAQEEESPWPESGSATAQIRAVRAVVRQLEAKVESMRQTVAQQARWTACIERVPVSEFGDPDRQFGYVYDERDGTGLGHMPALAVDRTSRPRARTTSSSRCRREPTARAAHRCRVGPRTRRRHARGPAPPAPRGAA